MSTPVIAPSKVTCDLVDLLVRRDAFGQKKYGSSLDRKDLSIEEWLDHQTEELLDGAGYAQAAKREITKLRAEVESLRLAAREYAMLHRAVKNFTASMEHGRDRIDLRSLMNQNDADVTLRQLQVKPFGLWRGETK